MQSVPFSRNYNRWVKAHSDILCYKRNTEIKNGAPKRSVLSLFLCLMRRRLRCRTASVALGTVSAATAYTAAAGELTLFLVAYQLVNDQYDHRK